MKLDLDQHACWQKKLICFWNTAVAKIAQIAISSSHILNKRWKNILTIVDIFSQILGLARFVCHNATPSKWQLTVGFVALIISITVSTLTIRLNLSTCDVYSSLVEWELKWFGLALLGKELQPPWQEAKHKQILPSTLGSESLCLEMYFSKNPTMNLSQLNIFTELFNVMFRIPECWKHCWRKMFSLFKFKVFTHFSKSTFSKTRFCSKKGNEGKYF